MTHRPRTHRSLSALIGLTVLTGGVLAACGSDEKTSTSTEATEETYVVVPDAQVTTGLAATNQLLTEVAAAPDTAADRLDEIEASWFSYEGTVKKNDVSSYLDFEDALAAFDDGAKAKDTAAMTAAAGKFAAATTAYLAKFPG